jgi:hypothetical protein
MTQMDADKSRFGSFICVHLRHLRILTPLIARPPATLCGSSLLLLVWLAIAIAAVGCGRSGGNGRRGADAAPPARLPQFVDVTAAAGIRFIHENGARGRRYLPETMGAGGAFLDFNGDGWLDILLLNDLPLPPTASRPGTDRSRPTAALYRNNRDGTFADVTHGSGLDVPMEAMGCCAGDYDNDGREDLYITDALGGSRLFHNESDPNGQEARFRDVTAVAGVGNRGHWGTSCAWVDFDRDGWLDLFVCNYVKYSLAADQPCFEGGRRFYCRPTAYRPDTCTLYRNLGRSASGAVRFADVTRAAGIFKEAASALGVAVWDVDQDGWPDLLVANDLRANFLFRNRRDGTFEDRALAWGMAFGEDGTARAGMGIDAADTRNNGRAAVMISNFSGEPLSFFYQEDPPYFSDLTYEAGTGEQHLRYLGFGLLFLDYDNDGFKDAFVANGHIEPNIALFGEQTTYGQRNNLFHNRGGPSGGFDEVSDRSGVPFTYARVSRGAACGDYDNDGHPDLLITNNGGPAELLRNDGADRGHWLQITLRGAAGTGRRGDGARRRASNRSAIGAVVQVRANGQTQTDMVRSGSSYCSQSMLRLHFGLGAATRADWVRVKWPGGAEQTLREVRADQRLVLDEP